MNNKKYHTVRMKWTTKNTTLSEWNEQQKIPHVVVHFIPAVCYFLLFILFRQCGIFCCSFYSDSVVFYFLLVILFQQYGILCCSFYADSVVFFVVHFIPTVWYFLLFIFFSTVVFFVVHYHTVEIKLPTKNKIPHCRNKMNNKKYHTVGIKWTTKNNTLPE
jgi:energy-coupling factor transporter transmembrane protein EcfT